MTWITKRNAIAGILVLTAGPQANAFPINADVTHPDPQSRFVRELYSEPVRADSNDVQRLLEIQEALADIAYKDDADALAAFMDRKIMLELVGESLPLDG